jgi:hypothetical protein
MLAAAACSLQVLSCLDMASTDDPLFACPAPAGHPQNQHDVLCVLLMIRLNSEHRSLMARRRVPCLDDYLDRINLVLWPRFKVGR